MSKQTELKGVERPKLRDVEAAADEYIEICDKAKRVAEDKKAGAEKLVMAMQRNKVRSYRWDGHIVTLKELEKVSVRDTPSEGDDD